MSTPESLSAEKIALPKQPERLTVGRYGEQLWGYDGDIGSYHEMGMRYERDCKLHLMESFRVLAENADADDVRQYAVDTLAFIEDTTK